VHAGRHLGVRRNANRIPGPIDHGLAHVDGAKSAIAHELDSFGQQPTAACLRAHLHDPIAPARRLDHPPAFDDVVADGFLDVDILAGLAGQDGHQRVPVVGRRDRHRIDVAVVERAGSPSRSSDPPTCPSRRAATCRSGARRCRRRRDSDVLDAGEMLV
jgi:hypothetical protein